MSLNLNALSVYVCVAEKLSFTAAARALRMSVSAVSKQLTALEDDLGVQLVNRSTHSLFLTEAGEVFYRRCLGVLAEIEEAKNEANRTNEEIVGSLRLHSTLDIGQHVVVPALVEFSARYPQINVELTMGPASISVIENRLDLGIRTRHKMPTSERSIAQHDIGPVRYVVCAAPAYLDRSGRPERPADLKRHNCIIHTTQSDRWRFSGERGTTVKVSGHFNTNNSIAAREAVLRGIGIARLPDYVVRDMIETGHLETLFPGEAESDRTVRAYYPRAARVPAKVTAAIEFLTAWLANEKAPPEPPPPPGAM